MDNTPRIAINAAAQSRFHRGLERWTGGLSLREGEKNK
jgi:hypothetical protein